MNYAFFTFSFFFFFNDTATTEIYTLSLHDALPIFGEAEFAGFEGGGIGDGDGNLPQLHAGWALRFVAEDSADELLCLRLFVLREPGFECGAAGAVYAGRGGEADAGFLSAELYRGAVLEFGDYSESRLHDGAGGGGGEEVAGGT